MDRPSPSKATLKKKNKSRKIKNYVIYFSQVILIYSVVFSCIINLSLGGGNEALWSSLLSGALGYMLPPPGSGGTSNRKNKDSEQAFPTPPILRISGDSVDGKIYGNDVTDPSISNSSAQ